MIKESFNEKLLKECLAYLLDDKEGIVVSLEENKYIVYNDCKDHLIRFYKIKDNLKNGQKVFVHLDEEVM
jgi:c-di-AMP phosphodiesterase-like protein